MGEIDFGFYLYHDFYDSVVILLKFMPFGRYCPMSQSN